MSSQTSQETIRVVVAPDDQSAELIIPADLSRKNLTKESCVNLLQAAGVAISPAVIESVEALVQAPHPEQEEHRILIARSVPPKHGQDGHIEWAEPPSHEEQEAPEKFSHYQRSAFTFVKTGQLIGRVLLPTPGEDGQDVRGMALPAKPGKTVVYRIDETVIQDAQGRLIAQVDGIVDLSDQLLRVRRVLMVNEYVDFSTGNIDFSGDVIVRRGVRDCFVIKCSGNVTIYGLIEAASIDCGEDMNAFGGMAGRERGDVTVGRNLNAKYLDSVRGIINGDLVFDNEVVNSDLEVLGEIRAPHGRIIGGQIVINNKVDVATLGSTACVETRIIAGGNTELAPMMQKLTELTTQLESKCDALTNEQRQISENTKDNMAAAHRERQTEIMFELHNLRSKLDQCQSVRDAVAAQLDRNQVVDLLIQRRLHAGVVLMIANKRYRIRDDLTGPVRIFRDSNGRILCAMGESDPKAITWIADVT